VWQAGVLAHRDSARALRVTAAAYALRARTGGDFAPFFRARAEQVRAAAEARIGDQAAHTWREGARLTLDEGLAAGGDAAGDLSAPYAGAAALSSARLLTGY